MSGTYQGRTSQGREVVIHVVNDALISPTWIRYAARCQSHPGVELTGMTLLSGPLHGATFTVHGRYTTPIKGGLKARHSTDVRLTMHGRSLRGTYRNVAIIISARGRHIDRCDTGRVTFSARM